MKAQKPRGTVSGDVTGFDFSDWALDYPEAFGNAMKAAILQTLAEGVTLASKEYAVIAWIGEAAPLEIRVALPLGPEFDEPVWKFNFQDIIDHAIEDAIDAGDMTDAAAVRDELRRLADHMDKLIYNFKLEQGE